MPAGHPLPSSEQNVTVNQEALLVFTFYYDSELNKFINLTFETLAQGFSTLVL